MTNLYDADGREVWAEWLPHGGHSAMRLAVDHRLTVRVLRKRARLTHAELRVMLDTGPRAHSPTMKEHDHV